MTHGKGQTEEKISPQFAARLDQLGPEEQLRVIVLVHTAGADVARARRQNRAERQAAIKAMRQSTEQALEEIDAILERFDGRRLAGKTDALGSIAVETTAPGIEALAAATSVKAILEDQEIRPVF